MDIPGISAADPVSLASARGKQKVDKDAFMQLLVAKLEHQDPLSPEANEDFLSQLATFTSLEEMEEMNGNLMAMMTLNQSNALLSQLTQSSSLLGKQVTWMDPRPGEQSTGAVDSVVVRDGIAMLRVGDQEVPLGVVTEILADDMEYDMDGAAEDADDSSADDATES